MDLWADLEGKSLQHIFCPSASSSIFRQLNKMKSLSRIIVNMGEICVVKCFVKIICKWRRGSAVQFCLPGISQSEGYGWAEALDPIPPSLACSQQQGLFPHPAHCILAQLGRPQNYEPGWITSGHFQTSGQCSTINYTGHLFLPLQFHNVC